MEKKRTGYKRYPSELKERAVRMVLDLQRSDPGDKSVISRVARQLGVGEESLRVWVKRAQIDAGTRPGLTTEEREELKRLRKENFELQRANDILQAAATFFGAELDRRQKRQLPSSTPTGTLRPVGVVGESSRFAINCRSPPALTTTPSHGPSRLARRATKNSVPRSKQSGRRTTPSTDGANSPRPRNDATWTVAATRSSDS